jgi:hypothetical protein
MRLNAIKTDLFGYIFPFEKRIFIRDVIVFRNATRKKNKRHLKRV